MAPRHPLGQSICLFSSGRGPGVAGSKRGRQEAREVAMGARGKTLVPLLLLVAASLSTHLQVEPEEPGELLWGCCCGSGGGDT